MTSATDQTERDIIPVCEVVYLDYLVGRLLCKANSNLLKVLCRILEGLATLSKTTLLRLGQKIVRDRDWIMGLIKLR